MTIAKRLRVLRVSAGLSSRALSLLAGLSAKHAWQVEAGAIACPTADSLRDYARVLGCSVGWLANGEGAAPSARKVRAAVARQKIAA
jgi:transcriptional regulator with XRE-family HTH domain